MQFSSFWPAKLRPALQEMVRTGTHSKRADIHNTVVKFSAWCEDNGLPVAITETTFRAFEGDLRRALVPQVVNRKMRYLYSLGIVGSDLDTRDFLFENYPDKRSLDAVLSSPWWPNIPRILASSLAISEKRRVVLELDNFFRWQERTRSLPIALRLQSLFLAEDLAPRTRYQRLSRLCRGLDAVLPGDPDLAALRVTQKALYSSVWLHAVTERLCAKRLPDVEEVLADYRSPRTGSPMAEGTQQSRRAVLNLHSNILAAAGRPLAFDKAALDLFADHARARHEAWLKGNKGARERTRELGCWCSRTVAAQCMHLAPFITDAYLKRKWYSFAGIYERLAETRGEPKMKERALAKRPTDLNSLFLRADDLRRTADGEMNIQTRDGLLTVIGALGILLFYPLRRSDLLKLRVGRHLKREATGWLLVIGSTRKTRHHVDPLVLPAEATNFLDACLLGGMRREHLLDIYLRRQGEAFLKSPRRNGPYAAGSFSDLFKRWTGHSPHVIRTLWCDDLVARGADRVTISAMLQHGSLISQKSYEIIAGKIRRIRAVEALREIGDRASSA